MEDQKRTLQQIQDLLSQISDELEAAARNQPIDLQVNWQADRSYTFTRAEVLTHVATHGAHHRAQCLNILRHLGVVSLPQSSVHEWMMQRN